jgi:glutamate dehydrogenase
LGNEINLRELIKKNARPDQSRWLELFAQRLFARLPSEAAERLSAERMLAIAQSAFEFFFVCAEPIAVRVLSSPDADGTIVVQSVMRDCPFIVDSTREYLHELGAELRLLLHPIFNVDRDAQGKIISFEQASSAETRESFIHAEVGPGATAAPEAIEAELRSRLEEVRTVTDDFEAMAQRALAICEETAAIRELVEARELLRWLVQGGFVFLGYRRYVVSKQEGRAVLAVAPESGLGLLRDESRSRYAQPRPLDELDAARRKLLFEAPALIVGKTHALSRVHRRAAMDDVTIRHSGADGQVVFDRFLGLFTSKAYAEEAEHIPVLRAKLREVLEAERAVPGSHDYKEIVAAFNSFPKEELFRASIAEIRAQLSLIFDLKSETEVLLNLYPDPDRRTVTALIVMPRERFSADVRVQIQDALAQRLGGPPLYYHLALGEGYTARLHFCFAAQAPPAAILTELREEIARLARTWEDRLRDELAARFGARRGHAIARRWSRAFGPEYKASHDVGQAVGDIERIETMFDGAEPAVALSQAGEEASELRIYDVDRVPALSELMPLLQNFGIRVLSEDAHEFAPQVGKQTRRAAVQAFKVQTADGLTLAEMPGASLVAEAMIAVRTARAEDDPLNALTLAAGLSWREVALMRAYLAAAFQMRLAPARPALRRVLLAHPELARTLIDLFSARLDPDRDSSPGKIAESRARYLDELSTVDVIADDRVARSLLSMIEATVRTNYFRPIPSPNPYIALKFESAKISDLPDDPPLYEIHVNSPRMEGCHLRAGKVARGGIRYSDRTDDYRTEILGLMKTQTVKNAIIVPVGSKGGFIVKPRPGQATTHDDVVESYKTLMNAMLGLTDNVVEGKLVHPERVKVLDNDRAYLVVAADKGTAAFSDIANEIATGRGFWLGDAFASGGKHGYDHKKMGITARGAWESFRRHMREIGRDPARGAPVVLTGIGDMSGDVFGNGLLQSSNLKLIAAFNHRHIFLDPDPDPAKSFAERKRLFETAGSQWSDYAASLLSDGGGVFNRGQKRIVLSPEVRTALKCEPSELDSENLIRAILRADAELLYNGGIGTFVRASDETDAQVGDHANDSCRIVADELRAKIVVEGGNLGFTQRARIEYALAGGRINTDAIDNSAGVDMSDHEVNLKILLQPALLRGALSFDERNRALAQAANEVAELVLQDNRDQALMLSLEQIRSRTRMSAFRNHLTEIEQRGVMRRHEEALPTHEALRERRTRYPGLTRPELAVLTAFTKIDLTHRLEETALLDDPYLVGRFLVTYFPASIAGRFAAEIPGHMLRREIIATRLVNELVDLMGSIFVFTLSRDYGLKAEDAVRAWLIGNDLLGGHERVQRLKASASELTVDAEMAAYLAIERAVERAARWAVASVERERSIADVVAKFRPAHETLGAEFESMLLAAERERFERTYRGLRASVHQESLAHDLARLAFADHLLSVLDLSFRTGVASTRAAAVYFRLSEYLDFDLLEAAVDAIVTDDRWERRAAEELAAELRASRIELCRLALVEHKDLPDAGEAVRRMRQRRAQAFGDVERLLAELRASGTISLAALEVATRALVRLAKAS